MTGHIGRLSKTGRHGLSGSSAAMGEERDSLEAKLPVRVHLLGALFLLGPLALLGESLIKNTHHRPLGAATFASVAVIMWITFECGSRLLFDRLDVRSGAIKGLRLFLLLGGGLMSVAAFFRALF